MGDYLKVFTELDKDKIGKIMREFEADKSGRLAQKTLAYEVTKIVHGENRAKSVVKVTEVLFGSADANDLNQSDVDLLADEIPILEASGSLIKTLVESNLASSNSEATRFISEGSVSINGRKVGGTEDTFESGYSLLRRGKNSFALVKSQ